MNGYERYNLRANPFTDVTLAGGMINRVKAENDLREKLLTYMGSRNPAIIPLIGEYGVGKTFFVLQSEQKVNNKKFFDGKQEKVLASYITATFPKPSPKYIHYVYSAFVNRIGLEKFKELASDLNNLKHKEELLGEFELEFGNALKNFKGNESVVWRYIRGDTIDRSETKDIGVRRSISDDKQSLNAFLSFLKMLYILDYKSLVLFVDEFEYLFAKGSRRGADFLNKFRFLYDRALERLSYKDDIANPIFIVACSPLTWNLIHGYAKDTELGIKPFYDRTVEGEINLKPFSKQETKDFVLLRLEKWRINKSDKDRIKLFPFVDSGENDVIPSIRKVSGGLPRNILRYTAIVLQKAYDQGYKTIGRAEYETLLKP